MRTVKEPDVRKQEILDGAIRVFAEKGYDRATISTIARELNISQGLCYRYFPSKEDIYNAAIQKYAGLILQAYLRRRPAEAHITDRIAGISRSIDCLTVAESGDTDLYTLFHGTNSRRLHDELLLQVAAAILPYVQEDLRRATEKQEICIKDPEKTAVLGLYGAVGVLLTEGLSAHERQQTICMGWNRLLGLQE